MSSSLPRLDSKVVIVSGTHSDASIHIMLLVYYPDALLSSPEITVKPNTFTYLAASSTSKILEVQKKIFNSELFYGINNFQYDAGILTDQAFRLSTTYSTSIQLDF
jgi:hypothetical protein